MDKNSTARLVYSVPEAAHLLHCSASILYDQVKVDRFPHVHISKGRVVIPKEALERFLKEQSENLGKTNKDIYTG